MATREELDYLIRVNDRDLKELKRNIDTVNKAADDDLGKSSAKADSHLRRINRGAMIAAGAVGGALVVGIKKSVDAAIDAQRVQKATEAQLKSLGISYKAHRGEIDKTVNSTSKLAALDDEDLQQSFTRLVPATHNVKKALTEMQLAADVARARNISLESATNLVIRANTGSAGALRRLGISLVATNDHVAEARRQLADYRKAHKDLSPAMEKHFRDLIAQAGAQDKAAQATKNISKLQQTFGGAAESYGKSAAGAQDRYKVALENVQEAIGMGLLPILAQLLNMGANIMGWMQENQGVAKILIAVLLALSAGVFAVNAAFKVYAAAQKAVTAATWLWNAALAANPIALVVIAIAALGLALFILWKKSETFREIVTGAFNAVLSWVRQYWPVIAILLSGPFAPLVALATNAFGVRSALVGAFTAMKNWAVDKVGDIVRYVRGVGDEGYAAAKHFGGRIVGGVQDGLTGVVDFVGGKIGAAVGAIRGFGDDAYRAGSHMGGRLKDGIADAFKGLGGALLAIGKAAINAIIRLWNEFSIPSFKVKIAIPHAPDIHFSTPEINFPDIPYLQRGGILTGETLFVGGERGRREAVLPLESQGGRSVLSDALVEALRDVGGDASRGDRSAPLVHIEHAEFAGPADAELVASAVWRAMQ